MNKLFEVKGYLSKYYAKYSTWVDKAIKFVIALLAFTFINQNIGFSEIISNPLMPILLAVICMMLPSQITVVFATIATILQLLTLSVGATIVAGALFLVMYGFFVRYAPGKAIIIVLVPIAFMLHIPVVIPIVLGLIGSPICILPVSMGTMFYYLIDYVKSNTTLLETVGEGGVMEQVATYAQQILVNREMWCSIIAFAICLLLVYNVRRMSVDYSWEIAIIAGTLGNINAMAYGYIIMDIQLSYVSLIVGSVVAVIAALIVKFFVFSVDYTRTERLQFEDDEYYYYVKAVPKSSVTIPEKTVKRINECQKTGVIDVEQVQKMEELKEEE
jgi:hypothetical protein